MGHTAVLKNLACVLNGSFVTGSDSRRSVSRSAAALHVQDKAF